MDNIKDIIRAKIKETQRLNDKNIEEDGIGYNTPFAFNKNTNAKGTKDIYYYKLGYY